MTYFTSDWHLGDPRYQLFYRDKNSIYDMMVNFLKIFKDGDTLYHLGDAVYEFNEDTEGTLSFLKSKYPNSELNLIIGNYDEDKLDLLKPYFNIHEDFYFEEEELGALYLNHYPVKCKKILQETTVQLAITGHIHSLWKVQRGMINVGVDAWHYKPVSLEEIKFCWNAMQKFYDENVFPY